MKRITLSIMMLCMLVFSVARAQELPSFMQEYPTIFGLLLGNMTDGVDLQNLLPSYQVGGQVWEPAKSYNTPSRNDNTYTLVYRVSISGDVLAWGAPAAIESSECCPEGVVATATKLTTRDSGYLYLRFALFGCDPCNPCLPAAMICGAGNVALLEAWLELDRAKLETVSGSADLVPTAPVLIYSATGGFDSNYQLPTGGILQMFAAKTDSLGGIGAGSVGTSSWGNLGSWGNDLPTSSSWGNLGSWGNLWSRPDCETNECSPWNFTTPTYNASMRGLLKIHGWISPEYENIQDADYPLYVPADVSTDQLYLDILSGPATETPLNRIIGAGCCQEGILHATTMKGVLSGGVVTGKVNEVYNPKADCDENMILCFDLRFDTQMTRAHNQCEGEIASGDCTP